LTAFPEAASAAKTKVADLAGRPACCCNGGGAVLGNICGTPRGADPAGKWPGDRFDVGTERCVKRIGRTWIGETDVDLSAHQRTHQTFGTGHDIKCASDPTSLLKSSIEIV
jgi:hypothetical protein